MTVVRLIKSTVLLEYSAVELANSLKRPRFIIGATNDAVAASATLRSISLRVILLLGFITSLVGANLPGVRWPGTALSQRLLPIVAQET